jgi:hypothetical protein
VAVVQQGEGDCAVVFGDLCGEFGLPVRGIGAAPAVEYEEFHENLLGRFSNEE